MCPAGHPSIEEYELKDAPERVEVHFAGTTCEPCPLRSCCPVKLDRRAGAYVLKADLVKVQSLIAAGFKVARRNADLFRLAFIGADETHSEMHSESAEHASILRAITDLFRDAVDSGEMEAVDPEIAARLATGLLQHAMIEAFVFGLGEESNRLEQGVSALLLNALRRRAG